MRHIAIAVVHVTDCHDVSIVVVCAGTGCRMCNYGTNRRLVGKARSPFVSNVGHAVEDSCGLGLYYCHIVAVSFLIRCVATERRRGRYRA